MLIVLRLAISFIPIGEIYLYYLLLELWNEIHERCQETHRPNEVPKLSHLLSWQIKYPPLKFLVLECMTTMAVTENERYGSKMTNFWRFWKTGIWKNRKLGKIPAELELSHEVDVRLLIQSKIKNKWFYIISTNLYRLHKFFTDDNQFWRIILTFGKTHWKPVISPNVVRVNESGFKNWIFVIYLRVFGLLKYSLARQWAHDLNNNGRQSYY